MGTIDRVARELAQSALDRLRTSLIVARLLSTDDSGAVQEGKIETLQGDTRDRAPIIPPFGLASNPPDGSRLVGIAMGGDGGRVHVLGAVDDSIRPKDLPKGTVVLYTQAGIGIRLDPNGDVSIDGADVNLNPTGDMNLNAGVDVNLNATNALDLVGATISITAATVTINGVNFSAHQHSNGNGGANTGPPI